MKHSSNSSYLCPFFQMEFTHQNVFKLEAYQKWVNHFGETKNWIPSFWIFLHFVIDSKLTSSMSWINSFSRIKNVLIRSSSSSNFNVESRDNNCKNSSTISQIFSQPKCKKTHKINVCNFQIVGRFIINRFDGFFKMFGENLQNLTKHGRALIIFQRLIHLMQAFNGRSHQRFAFIFVFLERTFLQNTGQLRKQLLFWNALGWRQRRILKNIRKKRKNRMKG